jgi:hypothetical protein
MRKTLLASAAASGLAIAGFAGLSFAQTPAAPNADQTKHAVSPDTGKAKSTPNATQIPGSSTTGNATGPAGGSGPMQGQAGSTSSAGGNRPVPSPARQ